MASDLTLERALDELYGAPLDAFTAKRDELARALKAAGADDDAAALKKRKKPTTVAWILNQLGRRRPDDIAALLDAGRALARAQRRALRGEGNDELAAALTQRRETVAAAMSGTGALLAELGLESYTNEVAASLQAALVNPVLGAQLEEGRLDKALESDAGFDLFAGAPVAAPAPHARSEERKRPARDKERKPAPHRASETSAAQRRSAARQSRIDDERAAKERAAEERAAKEREEQAAVAAELTSAASEARALADEAARVADEAQARADELAATAKTLAADAKKREAEAAAYSRKMAGSMLSPRRLSSS